MKKIELLPILSLSLVLLTSGCVEGMNFGGLFGGFTQEKEAPKDVLVIDGLRVIPKEPISATSEFTISFYVRNIDEHEEATNVIAYVYDWGRCKPIGVNTANNPKALGSVYPGSTEVVEWKFRAPSNEDLGNMRGKCPISFVIKYNFQAYTRVDTIVVSKQKLREVSRSGEKISVSPTMVKSRGPIKLDIDYGTPQPFTSGTEVPFTLRIINKGSGLFSHVNKNSLKIYGDRNLPSPECRYPEANLEGAKAIPIIDDKRSPPIHCSITAPNVQELRTFTLKADLSYTYPLYKTVNVNIRPIYTNL